MRISQALNQKDRIISDLRVQIQTLMKNFEQVKLQGLQSSIEAKSLKDINILL